MTNIQSKMIGPSYRYYLLNKLWTLIKSLKSPKKSALKNISLLTKEHYYEILGEILLATVIMHPILLEDVQEYLGRICFKENGEENRLENLRTKLLESYFSSASIELVDFLNVEKLESYAPFLKKSTPLERVKEGWMDVWHQYIKQGLEIQSLNSVSMEIKELVDSKSWEAIRHLKSNLIVGDKDG